MIGYLYRCKQTKLTFHTIKRTVYARDSQAQHNQKFEINRENSCTGCSYGCYNVKPFQDKQIRDNQCIQIARTALFDFVITRLYRKVL